MPVKQGKDSKGDFYKWGKSGRKYYFDPKDKASRERAKKKSREQESAIYAKGYKE